MGAHDARRFLSCIPEGLCYNNQETSGSGTARQRNKRGKAMRSGIETTDISEAVRRENASVLYDGASGTIVRIGEDTILSDIPDGMELCGRIQELGAQNSVLYCVKSDEAAQVLLDTFHFAATMPCVQAVYTKPQPPALPPCDIRPLTQLDAAFAAAHYHPEEDNLDYLRGRIAAGRMWGLFEGDAIAGFIGMHPEGSMGLLEVLPEYRRRGYGYLLEAYLIRLHLQRGWTPYCHVVKGNEASLRLQKKLGFEFAEKPAIWVF